MHTCIRIHIYIKREFHRQRDMCVRVCMYRHDLICVRVVNVVSMKSECVISHAS